jgi:hypothetical protein
VAFLSTVPPVVLVLVSIFEPLLFKHGVDQKELAEGIDTVVVACMVLVLATLVYFISYVRHTDDPRLAGKKGRWIIILLAANVFALPVFWMLYLMNDARASSIGEKSRNT